MARYADLMARALYARGKRCGLGKVLFNPQWRFFRGYVLRLGFLDGWRGLVFHLVEANYVRRKYLGLYMLSKGLLWPRADCARPGRAIAIELFGFEAVVAHELQQAAVTDQVQARPRRRSTSWFPCNSFSICGTHRLLRSVTSTRYRLGNDLYSSLSSAASFAASPERHAVTTD